MHGEDLDEAIAMAKEAIQLYNIGGKRRSNS
jgi:predicted RNase H-like HicB family nuclease